MHRFFSAFHTLELSLCTRRVENTEKQVIYAQNIKNN